MDIEEILTHPKIDILKILCKENRFMLITDIWRKSGVSGNTFRKHLNILVDEGLVEKIQFERLKNYRINNKDLRTQQIRKIFNLWNG